MPAPIAAAGILARLGGSAALAAARSTARRMVMTGGAAALGAAGALAKRAAPIAVGTAAGMAFPWGGGQPRRRSRGRGISAAELRGFRKVANLVKQYTAPGRRTLFRAPGRKRR